MQKHSRLFSLASFWIAGLMTLFLFLAPAMAEAASLNGTYLNQSNNSRLTITNANDTNGTFNGQLVTTIEGTSYTFNIAGNYSFSNQAATTISFNANYRNDPSRDTAIKISYVGLTDFNVYRTLNMVGGQAQKLANNTTKVCPLGGPFVRQ